MFAPNVYGHADKKMGIIRSIVGGKKAENGVQNGRRGRIHTLLIGDPGTAKTALSINPQDWIQMLEWLMLQEHRERA